MERTQHEGLQLILKERLQQLLGQHAWTAAELARRSGVPKQVLSLWLSGVEPRKISHLKSVARTLGVTVDELCFLPDGGASREVAGNAEGQWLEGIFEGRIRVARFTKGVSE